MNKVLDVVGTIGAIWLAVSILVGLFWVLAGRRIFRKPPQPPVKMVPWTTKDADRIDVDHVIAEIARRDRMNGRGF